MSKEEKAIFVHGEVNFIEVDKIPNNAKKKKVKGKQLIVGESETSGNHHCIEADSQKIEFYEVDDVLYLRVKEPAKAFCLHKNRHDDMIIPPGNYKRKISKEHDYFTMSKRNVQD